MAIRTAYRKFIVDDVSELDDVALIAGLSDGDECIVKTGGPLYYSRSGSDWVLKADTMSYANSAAFPVTGKTNRTYIAEDTNNTYRWDGTAYVSIGAGGGGLSLGETNTTAYRGDRGKTAFDHSQSTHAPTDAQKNSDITKAEIEAKLTGEISSHTHASETDNNYTSTDKTKVDFISVSQPVDLDNIESRVNELDAAVILKGTWDASTGSFPGGGIAQAGWSYIVSVQGTVDGVVFISGDRIIAVTDNASSTTFSGNWFKADYTDAVLSVEGQTGAVNLGAVISAAADATPNNADQLATSDSGTLKKITWTNVKAFLKTYFDTVYQAVLVSGTDIKTINSQSLLGSGNLTIGGGTAPQYNQNTADQGAGFATDTYVTGSRIAFPSGSIKVGSRYYCMVRMTKTNAGTATPIVNIRVGTTGTTSDASRGTLTWTAGTAAADDAVLEVWMHFLTVGSGTSATIRTVGRITHKLSVTGFTGTAAVSESEVATSGGFDSTAASLGVGISINGGTSASWTLQMVQSSLENLT